MRAMEKKHRERIGKWWSYPFLHSLIGGFWHQRKFKTVQHFVLFLGYPRSGHSLIGSLIDAHPYAVVSNQMDALSFIEQNYSRKQLFYLIRENTVKQGEAGRGNSGYDYEVPNQWQGRHKSIQLIGDKRGGTSSKRLYGQQNFSLLERTKEITQLPLKIVHVVRNPFDNITTMVTRAMKNKRKKLPEVFDQKIDSYFTKTAINQKAILETDYEIHTMYSEDLNRQTLQDLIDFLELPNDPAYLDDCISILWDNPNRSSQKVDFWTPERIAIVYERMADFPHLARYKFA